MRSCRPHSQLVSSVSCITHMSTACRTATRRTMQSQLNDPILYFFCRELVERYNSRKNITLYILFCAVHYIPSERQGLDSAKWLRPLKHVHYVNTLKGFTSYRHIVPGQRQKKTKIGKRVGVPRVSPLTEVEECRSKACICVCNAKPLSAPPV